MRRDILKSLKKGPSTADLEEELNESHANLPPPRQVVICRIGKESVSKSGKVRQFSLKEPKVRNQVLLFDVKGFADNPKNGIF